MLSYELAINRDGEPFPVPTQVKGWRVARRPHRGRPALLHERGKPLIIPVDATHADLLAVAGPGRYMLDAVDERGCKVESVQVAWTGPLSDDEHGDDTRNDDDGESMSGGSAVRRMQMEDVVCQLLTNQARMVEATLGQMGTVIAGVAGLLHAVHQTGVLPHAPPQVVVSPPPAPMPPPVDPDEDEDEDEDEGQAVELAPPSMLPEALRLIIERAVDKLVPLIFEKITSGEGMGGLPLAAFFDWRKARPDAAASAPSVPVPAAAPVSATPSAPTPAPAPPPTATPRAASASAPASYAAHGVTTAATSPLTASAGAAPSPIPPLGAAPAEAAPAAATSSLTPQELTQENAAAMLNAHILQIWQGLSSSERSRASELIAGLSDAQRTAWFAELARLTVPEAIARARAVLRAPPPPTSPNTPLLTATPKGEPS